MNVRASTLPPGDSITDPRAATMVASQPPLARRMVQSTAISLGAQFIKISAQIAGLLVLARLIPPADFGLFAIAYAITGFLEIARDGGMVVPLVQAERLTSAQLNNVFWFNAALGTALMSATVAMAPVASRFYRDDRLFFVLCAMSTVFLVTALSTQGRALLRRDMRFATLAKCEVTAFTLSILAAIVSAYNGAGYWALVVQNIAAEVLLGTFIFTAAGWRPGRPVRGAGALRLVKFGGLVMTFEFINYLNQKLDNLIVGRFLGPVALGLYDRAYQLLLLPLFQISYPLSGVVHSSLCRMQADPEQWRTTLRNALLLSTGAGMPIVGYLYGTAESLIPIVLGPQWIGAASVFRALAPAALMMTITIVNGWIFMSLGRARRQLPWSLFTTGVTIAAFFAGLPWGIIGVAALFSASRVLLLIPTLMFTCHGTPARARDLLQAVSFSLGGTVVAVLVMDALKIFSPAHVFGLLYSGIIFVIAYSAWWLALPMGRSALRDMRAMWSAGE
jgi:O-antigen/teichoic acid export membrane protein